MKEIQTKRLTLRSFRLTDLNDFYEYLSDESLVLYEPYEALSKSQCLQELDARQDNPAYIAVVLTSSSKLIGNIYLKKIEPNFINTYELGFIFNRLYHKKGYAKEASKAMMSYAFEALNAHRIIAQCNTQNNDSWQLLEHLNMRREATKIKNMCFKTDILGRFKWFDSYEYATLEEEWLKAQK